MIRLLEFLAFVGVALGLHLAAGMLSPPAGGDAGGDAGAAFVTLRGAPAEIDDIVAAWTKPPEHSEPRQSLHQPIIIPDTPRPRAQIAPQPRLRDRAAPAFRASDDSAPQMDTRPAAPRPAAPTPKAIAPKAKPAPKAPRTAAPPKPRQNTQKPAVSGQR
ncbi:MAG: hypothetical protein CML69_06880, partial [Rhodobacteraceae bacterium]|nr:hypothetical protein [Paracoccaceae bacterium]